MRCLPARSTGPTSTATTPTEAKRDLAAAHRAVKPDGWIGLNDYVFFNSEDMNKYGVVEAVHEFCLEHDWEILGFGLAGRGQHDVLLRRRGAGEGSDD